MIFKDSFGQVLGKDTPIIMPIAVGQFVTGKIVSVNAGLGLAGESAQPHAQVVVVFTLPAAPTGEVPGILAIQETKTLV